MDYYYIVLSTILSTLLCLIKADNECADGWACMLLADTNKTCIQNFYRESDHTNIIFCNGRRGICCYVGDTPKTISQQKCFEWQEMEGFCRNIPLIANGFKPDPHSFPFMALIKFTKPNQTQPIVCGGVLIERQWVLTAGHCFDVTQNDPSLELTVYLGAHNFTGSGIAFKGKATVHPDYGDADEFADLALIHLDRKADITDTVKPACLVKNSSIRKYYFVAGWGLSEIKEYPQNLSATNLTATEEFDKCKLEDSFPDKNKTLCLRSVEILGDVCPGDSGSPIFGGYPGFSNCNYEAVAIVSRGNSCTLREGGFTHHTRVDYYRKWIEKTVWPHETKNWKQKTSP